MCGIFGVAPHPDAAQVAALGLHALQHRGQEAAGIAAFDGDRFNIHRAPGLVGDIFGATTEALGQLPGTASIGHTLYSTVGRKDARVLRENIQPLFADFAFGGLAIAHNGQFTNADQLRAELIERGYLFQGTTDTEVLMHRIATSGAEKLVGRVCEALAGLAGAYALVMLSQKKLIAVRDPHGIRPLVMGRLGESYVFASETCALDIIGADYVRDVSPGEIIVVDEHGFRNHWLPRARHRPCAFEHIYFSRPDSQVDGKDVHDTRQKLGAVLASESAVSADIVVPVPDSGVPAALGYARAADMPFEFGITRNHYVGRTFILPTSADRELGVRMKHNPTACVLRDKRVVLVDDSIVRGTTMRKIIDMLRAAGAREVHVRISSPPIAYSCHYGIDTPQRKRLLAARMRVEEMCAHLGADSLRFISRAGMYRALGELGRDPRNPSLCDACFTGDYFAGGAP